MFKVVARLSLEVMMQIGGWTNTKQQFRVTSIDGWTNILQERYT